MNELENKFDKVLEKEQNQKPKIKKFIVILMIIFVILFFSLFILYSFRSQNLIDQNLIDAKIVYTGSPVVDGCGYLIEIPAEGEEVKRYHATNLIDYFKLNHYTDTTKVDDIFVEVEFEKLDDEYMCGFGGGIVYEIVKIIKIRQK